MSAPRPSPGSALHELVDRAHVDPAVWELRPDYRAALVAVTGIVPGPSDATSDALLTAAAESVRELLRSSRIEDLPQVAAWRAAYRGFGAKPQRTRNSLEALLRRIDDGLPRVNRLTDLYNAVSITHLIPLGGEDLTRYAGPPRLVRATGDEAFDTTAGGENTTETADVGEVVWRDDVGVTCRRWNWRQCRRTRLTDGTTSALFILDALDPIGDDALRAATDDLVAHLSVLGPRVRVARRTVTPTGGLP